MTRGVRSMAVVLFVLVVMGVGRGVTQIAAMSIYTGSTRLTDIERAARFDPGSYRIQMRLADGYLSRGDCAKAVGHATAARRLFQNAAEPKAVLRRCGAK